MMEAAAAADGTKRWSESDDPIRVGVSACLLGREVRFDGGHKRDRYLTDEFGAFVEFVPVCPEVELGMGIPRESVRLVETESGLRMIAERSGTDHTEAMQRWCRQRVEQLERMDLCGYVLKRGSPSCGMERVRVYTRGGMPERRGRGLFADALLGRLSDLPVEEEGRLNDPVLRENFVERVFAYQRLRQMFRPRWTVGGLVAFHTAHKLQLMAHSPADYRTLGRLVAAARETPRAELERAYRAAFMAALGRRATPARHFNVLQHTAGYFRRQLDAESRAELGRLFEDYRAGLLPLIVPITLVRHYVRRFGVDYLDGQVYLEPHPKELMLRNRV